MYIMKTLVLIAHPNMEASKVNRAWRDAIAESNVTLRELYALYPNGHIDVPTEQALLLSHDRIVFQHPFYWYSVPPLLKQYFDEVLTYGFAYGEGGDKLSGKEWIEAITCGGPEPSYQVGGYNRYTTSELLRPVEATANLCQMLFWAPFVAYGVLRLSAEDLARTAEAYRKYISDPNLDISTPGKLFAKFSQS